MSENVESNVFTKVDLPTQVGFWTKFRNFWLQEITVELTPKQQKIEDEINEFLYQDVTKQKLHDLLLKEIHIFGKKDK